MSYTFSPRNDRALWEIFLIEEVNGWLDDLITVDGDSYRQAVYAIEALAEVGPNPARSLIDRIKGSSYPQPQRIPYRY